MANNTNTQAKLPREHPILRNVFYCIISIFILTPLIISLLGVGAKWLSGLDSDKTEETVGVVKEYAVETNMNGNSLWYHTYVEFKINNEEFSKTIKTKYYVAEPGEYIRLYYEKGNPMSVSPTKGNYDLTIMDKLNIFKLSALLCLIGFTLKAMSDAKLYREKKSGFAQMQQMNKFNIPNNNFNNGFNNNGFNNNGFNNNGFNNHNGFMN